MGVSPPSSSAALGDKNSPLQLEKAIDVEYILRRISGGLKRPAAEGAVMERYGGKEVRELLASGGFRLSKSMGQNFLIDPNIPGRIVRESSIDSTCGVLETGPGLGVLTRELCRVAGRVTAVELDARFIPLLRETLREECNIEIVKGDILKLDLVKLVTSSMPGLKYHACANLPYSITTPAITAFINADVFDTITVTIQREVAGRICAKPGTPEYGAFTVFTRYHMEANTLFDIPPECFIPRPRVYSSVVKMKKRAERPLLPEDEAFFFRVVRAAFGQRRKTLVNALYAAFGNTHDKEKIAEIVSGCGFDVRIRGETLGVEEFIVLSTHLKSKTNR